MNEQSKHEEGNLTSHMKRKLQGIDAVKMHILKQRNALSTT